MLSITFQEYDHALIFPDIFILIVILNVFWVLIFSYFNEFDKNPQFLERYPNLYIEILMTRANNNKKYIVYVMGYAFFDALIIFLISYGIILDCFDALGRESHIDVLTLVIIINY